MTFRATIAAAAILVTGLSTVTALLSGTGSETGADAGEYVIMQFTGEVSASTASPVIYAAD